VLLVCCLPSCTSQHLCSTMRQQLHVHISVYVASSHTHTQRSHQARAAELRRLICACRGHKTSSKTDTIAGYCFLWSAPTASCTLLNPSRRRHSASSLFILGTNAGPSYASAVYISTRDAPAADGCALTVGRPHHANAT